MILKGNTIGLPQRKRKVMDEIRMKRDEIGLDEHLLKSANKEKGEINFPKSMQKKMRARNDSVRQLTSRETRRFIERERKREERRNARKK